MLLSGKEKRQALHHAEPAPYQMIRLYTPPNACKTKQYDVTVHGFEVRF
jgi:hypothetical protein